MEAIILVQEGAGGRIRAYKFVGNVYDLFVDVKKLISRYPTRDIYGWVVVVNPEFWKRFMLKILKLKSLSDIYFGIAREYLTQEEIEHDMEMLEIAYEVPYRPFVVFARFYGRCDLFVQYRKLLHYTEGRMTVKDWSWFKYTVNHLQFCLEQIDEKLRVGYSSPLKLFGPPYYMIEDIPRETLERFNDLEELAYHIVEMIVENEDILKERQERDLWMDEDVFCPGPV
jgi:hypothetical protein